MTEQAEQSMPRQLQNGRAFVLDAPTEIPAICGSGSDVLWAAGEGLMIVGPQGVGKSTLMQQLLLARAGITAPEWLGYPVQVDTDRPLLYIAADRPAQIARSFRRMVTPDDAELLEHRLIVWRGPLPFDIVHEPLRYADFVQRLGVGGVFVDSVKDVASPLSDDKVGSAYNQGRSAVIAAGIDHVDSHHNRKATSDNSKPRKLEDVYGSVWLTAGCGSVLSLWGEAGDPLVELTHLKTPADEIGPLELEHDHQAGTTRRVKHPDAWSLLHSSSGGITAPDAADQIYRGKPSRAQIEKVRRRLERFVEEGHATPEKGALKTDPVRYRPITENGSVKHRVGVREGSRDLHAATRTPGNTDHDSYTHPDSSASPLRGGAERVTHHRPACSCIDGPQTPHNGRCSRCFGVAP